MQASQLYPLDEGSPLQVRSHQLFAACALFQATGELRYWNDTLTLYDLYFDALDQDLLDSPLYNPSANYRNPQWYALLCMAQSAPDASNIADDPLLAVPEHVDPSAESVGNETAAGWRRGQRAQYRQYLAAQLPETGTRMEVMRQLSNNFVYPWLTLQSQGSGGAFAQNDRLRCGLVLCCAALITSQICLGGAGEHSSPDLRFHKRGTRLATQYTMQPVAAGEGMAWVLCRLQVRSSRQVCELRWCAGRRRRTASTTST